MGQCKKCSEGNRKKMILWAFMTLMIFFILVTIIAVRSLTNIGEIKMTLPQYVIQQSVILVIVICMSYVLYCFFQLIEKHIN